MNFLTVHLSTKHILKFECAESIAHVSEPVEVLQNSPDTVFLIIGAVWGPSTWWILCLQSRSGRHSGKIQ